MKRLHTAICALTMVTCSLAAFADKSDQVERLNNAKSVLDEIMATPDKAIPNSILSNAYCVIVIPSMKKAAFVVGGQYGRGVATCRNTPSGKWSAPIMIKLEGGSFGFQIGGQSTDLVLVGMNARSGQDMLKNKFKIGGDAAASAGPVGRNAQAGTDWKLGAEFLTWSRSKGLFAGIDLNGDVLSQSDSDTRELYGVNVPFETILKGQQAAPKEAMPFLRTVSKYFRAAQ
ncbi:MAG: lipid-binding SYLF domain-containing protein [Acidobacteria bacterium]|nr:lipid-binding SYLF domain-containing protein [Acidobacteriota bacterium]